MTEPKEKDTSAFFEKLGEINKHFINSELITPNNYYIDLSFIRDTRLGCILNWIDSQPTDKKESLFQSFRKGLLSYQTRMFDNVMVHFPELPLTEEEFQKLYHDKELSNDIFEMSPVTEYLHCIKANLEVNINHSQVAEKWKDKPLLENNDLYTRTYESVTFWINTYPLVLDKYNCDRIGGFLGKYFGINVRIISENPKDMDPKILEHQDDITLSCIGEYLENDAFRDRLANFKFVGKHVHTPCVFPIESNDKLDTNEKVKKEIEIITDYLRIYCHLQWIASARFAVDLSLFPIKDEEEEVDMSAPLPSIR